MNDLIYRYPLRVSIVSTSKRRKTFTVCFETFACFPALSNARRIDLAEAARPNDRNAVSSFRNREINEMIDCDWSDSQ